MKSCPKCNGQGKRYTQRFVNRANGCSYEEGFQPCETCGGVGSISDEHLLRIETGKKRREDRVSRDMSLCEEARRLGIKPSELNDIEHGRLIAVQEKRGDMNLNLSAKGAARLLSAMQNDQIAAQMDNRELLWRLMNSPIWEQEIGSMTEALLGEVAERLYPEFDGDKVRCTEYGWMTPEGEIRYDR